jgi:hypothetical protein
LSQRHLNATTDGFKTIGICLQTPELILAQAMQFVARLIGHTPRTEIFRRRLLECIPSGDSRSQLHEARIAACHCAQYVLLARTPPMQRLFSQKGLCESDLLAFRWRWFTILKENVHFFQPIENVNAMLSFEAFWSLGRT